MFLGFSNLFLVAVEGLMWSLDGFFWRIASIKEFFGILNQIHTVVDIPNAKRLSKVIGRVEFENVDFGYDVKRKVLKKVSFVAQPGKKIAFVGHTGSGKTTTSSLLLRFYEPNSGKILIDGVDIASVTQESLRQNI